MHCNARTSRTWPAGEDMAAVADAGSEGLAAGLAVKVFGLTKAAQHNGKVGQVLARGGRDGRVGVQLGDGTVLAVRRENLEPVERSGTKLAEQAAQGKQRTLKREDAVLREFDGSPDPDTLALYFHRRDRAFDAYNAAEYNQQMLRYYAGGLSVVSVVPRRASGNEYFLVGLRHKEDDENTLCDLAFQCMRQFVGVSMLVKRRCFVCNKPNSPMCVCQCACFCSKECEASGRDSHGKLCKLIQASQVVVAADEGLDLF